MRSRSLRWRGGVTCPGSIEGRQGGRVGAGGRVEAGVYPRERYVCWALRSC